MKFICFRPRVGLFGPSTDRDLQNAHRPRLTYEVRNDSEPEPLKYRHHRPSGLAGGITVAGVAPLAGRVRGVEQWPRDQGAVAGEKCFTCKGLHEHLVDWPENEKIKRLADFRVYMGRSDDPRGMS